MNLDYHVELCGHYYSVPYALGHQLFELRYSTRLVEVLHHGTRVALHPRSVVRGRFTTQLEHMPPRH